MSFRYRRQAVEHVAKGEVEEEEDENVIENIEQFTARFHSNIVVRRLLCQEVAMEKDLEQKTDDEKVVDNVLTY